MLDRFFSTFAFTSRIPLPFKYKFDAARIDFYLPIVGLCAAAINFVIFKAAFFLTGGSLCAVVIMLITQYLCFNLFHLDGLVDTADAFLGSNDKDKTNAILKDSRVGVYGLFAGAAALICKIVFLFSLRMDSVFLCVVLLYPVCGRLAAALIPVWTQPARKEGLGPIAKGAKAGRSCAGALIAAAVILVWPIINKMYLRAAAGIGFMYVCAFAVSAFYARVYTKRLGGYTGDALGAAVESGEILYILLWVVVSARW
jgi:adenosylcobinamide-GDP ribazoletransferase